MSHGPICIRYISLCFLCHVVRAFCLQNYIHTVRLYTQKLFANTNLRSYAFPIEHEKEEP